MFSDFYRPVVWYNMYSVIINYFRHRYIICIMWTTLFPCVNLNKATSVFFCVLRQWSMWSLPVKSRRIWDVGHSTFDRDFSFFSSKWMVLINYNILQKYNRTLTEALAYKQKSFYKNRGKYINSWAQPNVVIP